MSRVVLTLSGPDRPEIELALVRAIVDVRGNILQDVMRVGSRAVVFA